MSDEKISALNEATSPVKDMEAAVNNSGTTNRIKLSNWKKNIINTLANNTSYTILDNDGYNIIEANITTGGGVIDIDVPLAVNNLGRELTINLNHSSTGYADYLRLVMSGADTIDGDAWQFNGNGDTITIYSNGTKWKVKQGFRSTYVTNGDSYIPRSDYTNVQMGSITTLNTNSPIFYNLKVPVSKLSVATIISTDGTDNNSFLPVQASSANADRGIVIIAIDDNSFDNQTGNGGIAYLTSAGLTVILNSQAYSYKVRVKRLYI